VVPKSLHFNDRCQKCDTIQSIHNQVWACKRCNSTKGHKGLYEYFNAILNRKDYFDFIPPLLEKKYLKTIYRCHDCAGTLYLGDINGDGQLTVLDIDFILHNRK